jgi:NADP-dependent 3-hydroxy acid dehydrogenase YdfG
MGHFIVQKTAIVTGASRGVGYETVKLLSENGYKVIAASRDLSKFSNLESENVEACHLDLNDESSIKSFYEKYKGITLDLLVNNAGGGSGPTHIINETMENFKRSYEINVSGPMYLSQLFVPCLNKSKSSTIIFVSSLGGKFPYPSGGNYTIAKRGQMALVETMRLEFITYKIKVTEICPGTIDTQQEKKSAALTAQDMAECIRWVSSLPEHVNINHIEVNHLESGKW